MKYCILLLLCSLSLISAVCPPSNPQSNQCGPNNPCADGSCCSAQGFCGVSASACGCGCQNGRCLIPAIALLDPQLHLNLVAGVPHTVDIQITTPINAQAMVEIVQENTMIVGATITSFILPYTAPITAEFTPQWTDPTRTGVNGFFYRLSLIDANIYNGNPLNAWQTPLDSMIIHGVSIAAASSVTMAPTTPEPTKAPSSTSQPSSSGSPTMSMNPTTTPPNPYGLIMDPYGNPIIRTCPIVGNDTRHICQSCGYTICLGNVPGYVPCPSGTTCNPVTNECESSVYCVHNQASYQAPQTTDPPIIRSTTRANHGVVIGVNEMLLLGVMLIGMLMI